jgi:hypothetical protein
MDSKSINYYSLSEKWTLVRGTSLKTEERFVLITLFFYQGNNPSAFCRQESLAAEVGTSKRSIRRIIMNLSDAGIIDREWIGRNGYGMRHYTINFDKLKEFQRPDDDEGRPSMATLDDEGRPSVATLENEGRPSMTADPGHPWPNTLATHGLHEVSIKHPEKIHGGASLPQPEFASLSQALQSPRNFRSSEPAADSSSPAPRAPRAPRNLRFSKPTADDVRAYATERGRPDFDADRFIDYYESNGWRVGRSAMKDWQATLRGWLSRDSKSSPATNGSPSRNHSSDDWLVVLAAIDKYPSGSPSDIKGRKTLLGPERFEAVKRIGSGRIREANDYERNQTLKPMFLNHLKDVRDGLKAGN